MTNGDQQFLLAAAATFKSRFYSVWQYRARHNKLKKVYLIQLHKSSRDLIISTKIAMMIPPT